MTTTPTPAGHRRDGPVAAGPPPRPPRDGRALGRVGAGLLGLGVLAVLALHVLPPTAAISPWRRTISEYALGPTGWLFDAGVLALAAGSLAVLGGLVRGGAVPARGGAALGVGLWSAGLVTLVVFEKYDHVHGAAAGPGGMIHRVASLVAFVSLPVGALLATRRAAGRRADRPRAARWARRGALVSCGCLALLVYAIGRGVLTDVAWWRVFPLGALERLIAGAEVVTLLALGWWAARGGGPGALSRRPPTRRRWRRRPARAASAAPAGTR